MLNDYFAYNLKGIINLSASLMSLATGTVIISRSPRSRTHQSFFLITLTGSIWLFCYAMIMLVRTDELAYRWLKLCYLVAIPLVSPFVYLFSIYWTNNLRQLPRVQVGLALSCVFSVVMFLKAEAIGPFRHLSWGRVNSYGYTTLGSAFFSCVVVFMLVYACLTFINVFKAMRDTAAQNQRKQYALFLVGLTIGFLSMLDFLCARGFHVRLWGAYFYTSFILIVAYAILRHQFLEVTLFRKLSLIGLVYALLISLLMVPMAAYVKYIHDNPGSVGWLSFVIISGVTGGLFSMGPLIYAFLTRNLFWLKSNITTGLTHELKSPVSAIASSIDLLIDQAKKHNPDLLTILAYADIVRRNGERLEDFVKSLLSVAQIQDDRISLRKSDCDICEIAANAVRTIKPLTESKGIELTTKLPASFLVSLEREKIEQVFSNILLNATKFTSSGFIVLQVIRKYNEVDVVVTDSGRGISKEDLPHVFNRFFQGHHGQKGAGVGLAIAKAWVEAHGGKIWAKSEGDGRGTTVTFTLPT